MKASTLGALFLSLALLPACGRSLVEFGKDDNGPNGPPEVIAVVPLDGAVEVPPDTAISATFDRGMNAATIDGTTFTVQQGVVSVPGTVTYDAGSETATFTPAATLGTSAEYTATITTGAKDPDGTALAANFTWTFSTGSSAAIPPTVVSTTPLNLANNASLGNRPTATFSEPMRPGSINFLTFTLTLASVPIPGTVTLDSSQTVATFTPDQLLELGAVYTATITTGAEDTSNTALEQDYRWTFSTSACGMAPVDLGSAANFVALAGQAVTNTGLSVLTGDVGVSPGNAITGFGLGEGTINGAQHAGDAVALTAQSDLTTAYNEVAGRSLCFVTVADNIGGMTLAPGLYRSTSTLAISSGELTLDAQGDPDAIWVFQMASSLTVTSGRKVILAGGAKAANVYWQVGSAATLGTTVEFKGTIMAEAAITLETGATLDGRMLVRSDAVTLDSNIAGLPAN